VPVISINAAVLIVERKAAPTMISGANLFRNRQGFIDRNQPLCDAVSERRPLDQLHDERLQAIGLFEPVDVRDVRMIQRGQDFGFALKTRKSFGI
jgi:hypothetical protein